MTEAAIRPTKLAWAAALLILWLGGLAHPGPARAMQEPQPGPKDPRVLSVAYDPMDVVRILSAPTVSTQIVFAAEEQVERVAIGDSAAWMALPSGNILFVKPTAVHAPTNMQVVTVRADKSRRDYIFELDAQDPTADPAGIAGFFKVVFAYPSPAGHAPPITPRKPLPAPAAAFAAPPSLPLGPTTISPAGTPASAPTIAPARASIGPLRGATQSAPPADGSSADRGDKPDTLLRSHPG